MISIKTPEEIAVLAEGGKILATILHQIKDKIKPGVNTADLNQLAIELAKEAGGEPSFLNYKPDGAQTAYPSALCASINDEVVHAMGSLNRVLAQGDIISIDMGIKYKGLYTDMAMTVPVGSVNQEIMRLINVTKKALQKGIEAIKPGNHVHDISEAIQTYVESNNFSVVRDLVGHGVGYAVHEEPGVPNFVMGAHSPKLKEGMVLALEPMVNVGTWRVKFDDDGWTVRTADGKLSAHFEHTIAVTADGYQIITNL